MSEHKEHRMIWLEPQCAAEAGEDRQWCQDDVWGECDECGTPSVKYIIATEYDALVKALMDIRQAAAGPADHRIALAECFDIATRATRAAVGGAQ
jgi:hypothetical protein